MPFLIGISEEEIAIRTQNGVEFDIASCNDYYTYRLSEGKRTRETKFALGREYREPVKSGEFLKVMKLQLYEPLIKIPAFLVCHNLG